MEWIKSILEKHTGEDGKINLAEALKEINKSAPEHIVPKTQYNQIAEEKKQLNTDLKERDKQLEKLKEAGSVEDLTKQIETLQKANKQAKKDYDSKIQNMIFDAEIEKALKTCKHPELMSNKIDRTKLKINDDKTIDGLKEQVEGLTKQYEDMFNPVIQGRNPSNPSQDLQINSFETLVKNADNMTAEEVAAQFAVIENGK